MIDTIVLLSFRKHLTKTGYSSSEVFGRCQSLMCFRNGNGLVTVETPCKQVKNYYALLGATLPAHLKLVDYGKQIGIKL